MAEGPPREDCTHGGGVAGQRAPGQPGSRAQRSKASSVRKQGRAFSCRGGGAPSISEKPAGSLVLVKNVTWRWPAAQKKQGVMEGTEPRQRSGHGHGDPRQQNITDGLHLSVARAAQWAGKKNPVQALVTSSARRSPASKCVMPFCTGLPALARACAQSGDGGGFSAASRPARLFNPVSAPPRPACDASSRGRQGSLVMRRRGGESPTCLALEWEEDEAAKGERSKGAACKRQQPDER